MILQVAHCMALAGLGAAALAWLRRRPTPRTWLWTGLGFEVVALALAFVLGANRHLPTRLAAYAVFGFTPLLLFLAACVLRRTARKTAILSLLLAAGLLVVAFDAFLVEPHWLQVTFTQAHSPKLTRPVRLVLIADLQTDRFGAYERETLRRVADLRPDLILWAGDYLQAPSEQRAVLRQQYNQYLHELQLFAPLGSYAVRGNMDHGPWSEMFADTHIQAVERTQSFDLGDLVLTCLARDDSFRPEVQLPAAPPGRYHLMLGHSPDCSLSQVQADLILAGHTHGGQVRLPLLGPIITLSRVPRSMAVGLVQRPAGGLLYVSRGVGMERDEAPRLRFLCRPELAVIDLLPSAAMQSASASVAEPSFPVGPVINRP